MAAWLDGLKNAEPAAERDGAFFAQARDTGIAVLVDAKIAKTRKEPHQYKLVFDVKSTSTGANPASTRRVVLKSLDTKEFDAGYAKSQIATMTGVDVKDKPAIGKVFTEVFRLDDQGYTKIGTACPLAGTEYKFTVEPSDTRAGETQFHPAFTPVKYETPELMKAAVSENRKALGI